MSGAGVRKIVVKALTKYAPEIFLSLGLASAIAGIVAAAEGGKKAQVIEEQIAEERENDISVENPVVEKIKREYKCYIPAIVLGGVSIISLVYSHRLNQKKLVALLTAYELSHANFEEYREKVKEKFGADKEREVRNDICKDRAEKQTSKTIVFSAGEPILYKDGITGRYFTMTPNALEWAFINLNKQMLSEDYISKLDYLCELGIDPRAEDNAEDVGWNIDRGLLYFDTYYTGADDGRPCICVCPIEEPRHNYNIYN